MATPEQGQSNPELSGPSYDLWRRIYQVASGRYGPRGAYTRETGMYEWSLDPQSPVIEIHGTNLPGAEPWRHYSVHLQDKVLPGIDTLVVSCDQVTGEATGASVEWQSSSTRAKVCVASREALLSHQEILKKWGYVTYCSEPRQALDGVDADLATLVAVTSDSPAGAEYTRLAAEFGVESAGRNLLNGALEYVAGVVLPAVQQLQRDDGDPSATA